MDILRRKIPEINLINARAVLDIQGHSRRRCDVGELESRIIVQLAGIRGLSGEMSCPRQAPAIDLSDLLHNLKKPRSSLNSVSFQGRGDGETDRLVRSGHICHHKVRLQGVQTTLYGFYGGVEGF